MFPIAWAVVEGENRDSWGWFITILQEELNLGDGSGWSIISDQQKGLVDSLWSVLPFAEHRKCARHVSANWKIKHKSIAARTTFWKAVYASNLHEYHIHLQELLSLEQSGVDPDCHIDFLRADPTAFCRAYVSRLPKVDSIESNICETFNGCIVRWRGLRIINMLEGIRGYIMQRILDKVHMFDKNKEDLLCPRIKAKIEKGKIIGRNCVIRQTLDLVCECVVGEFGYVVDLDKFTCTCGYWELSGIPCVHAIAFASFLRKDIYYWTDKFYHNSLARKAYGYGGIPAMPGQQAWEEVEGLVVRPPAARIMPGRPKKNRRKEQQELEVRKGKNGVGTVLTRKGIIMHCRSCNKRGHNSRKCPEKTSEAPVEQPSTTPRRTRRAQGEGSSTPAPRRRKVATCGTCRASGHNARSCLRNRGVEVSSIPLSSHILVMST
ncbi:hypothetical protein LINPERHAP2_LOCUS5884 [Linum perenne]